MDHVVYGNMIFKEVFSNVNKAVIYLWHVKASKFCNLVMF